MGYQSNRYASWHYKPASASLFCYNHRFGAFVESVFPFSVIVACERQQQTFQSVRGDQSNVDDFL